MSQRFDSNILQHVIDDSLKKLKESWMGKIIFPMALVRSSQPSKTELSNIQDVNIIHYIHEYSIYSRMYFCPKKYPPPENKGSIKPLKLDLEKAAFIHGSPIYSDGGRGKNQRTFRCNCMKKRKKKEKEFLEKNYRDSSLIGDCNNDRENGRSLSRKTYSAESDWHCPFKFTVRWDSYGYFIKLYPREGCAYHSGHFSSMGNIDIPSKFMSKEEVNILNDLGNMSCSNTVGQGYV